MFSGLAREACFTDQCEVDGAWRRTCWPSVSIHISSFIIMCDAKQAGSLHTHAAKVAASRVSVSGMSAASEDIVEKCG